jgi:hypothetical protein
MATGTLVITRPHQWADRLRHYRLFVDGVEAGRIGNGSQLSIDLPVGERDLVAHIDWCRSNVFRVLIREGAVSEVEVGANATGWRLLAGIYFATLGWSHYLYLRHRATGFPVTRSGSEGVG